MFHKKCNKFKLNKILEFYKLTGTVFDQKNPQCATLKNLIILVQGINSEHNFEF